MVMFHETVAGKIFLEGSFPTFVQQLKLANEYKEAELKALTRQVFALEDANELKEKEFEFKKLELEAYSREILALEKANKLKEYELSLKEKELNIKSEGVLKNE